MHASTKARVDQHECLVVVLYNRLCLHGGKTTWVFLHDFIDLTLSCLFDLGPFQRFAYWMPNCHKYESKTENSSLIPPQKVQTGLVHKMPP